MLRRLIAILLLLPLTAFAQEERIKALLRIDKRVLPDSMYWWMRSNLKPLDSTTAFVLLDSIEYYAVREDNHVAIAAVPYLKAEYMLANTDERHLISYVEKAIRLTEKYDLDYQRACYTHFLGLYYYYHDDISRAIEYLLSAHDQFLSYGYNNVPTAGAKLYGIAYVYYHLHNYRECLRFLNWSRKYPSEKDYWISVQLENTSGLVYTELNNFDSAFYYFSRTQQIVHPDDTVWKGIVAGNIGMIYLKQKKYDQALPYLQKNYDYLKNYSGYSTVGAKQHALVALSEVYIAKNDVPGALKVLTEALYLHDTYKTEYWRQAYLYQMLANVYVLKGDYEKAYHYEKMYETVSDSIIRRDDALRYTHIQQELESRKLIATLKLLEAEKREARQKMLFAVMGASLLLFIGWLMYHYHRLQAKKNLEIAEKKKELLESEKNRAEANLSNAQNLLNEYLDNIRKKNELIETFKQEIERNVNTKDVGIQPTEQYEHIKQLEAATLLTDEDWGKFRNLFEKVHAGFFTRLKEKIPDLTEAEIRLLTLTKLQIGTKQMAQMLGISSASVHTARYRLRKKMQLSDEVILDDIVNNI